MHTISHWKQVVVQGFVEFSMLNRFVCSFFSNSDLKRGQKPSNIEKHFYVESGERKNNTQSKVMQHVLNLIRTMHMHIVK